MKTCPRCERELPLDQFPVDRSRASGRMSRCRDCDSAAGRAYYQANRGRKATYYQANRDRISQYYRDRQPVIRAARRDRRYGMAPGEWDALYAVQGGACYLCGDPLPADQSKVATDHDHSCCPGTGSCGACVRGLSCVPCNTLIARASDDPARLRRIADNLEVANQRVRADHLAESA